MTEDLVPSEPVEGIFTDLFSATMEPPSWLIEDLLPAGLTWVIGPPKEAHKSGMTLAMALQVAGFGGEVWPEHMRTKRQDGRVMVISAEASAGELRHDVERGMGVRGEANSAILIADDPWKFRLDRPDGAHRLGEWLDNIKPALLVLDPLRNLHSQDENDSGAMMDILQPWQAWAKKNNTGVICVHHVRKPSEQKDFVAADARGSGALVGMADGLLVVTPKSDHLLIKATFKRAASWERLIRLGIWGARAQELLQPVDRMVLKALSACGTLEEVAEVLKVGKGVVQESVKRLARNRYIEQRGRRWTVRRPR